MFKVIALFIITLFTLLYVWVGILFTHGMQLQDGIISQRRGVLANKTSLTPPLFYTKPGKSVVMYICVSGLDFATSSILIFDFGIYCFSVYCTNKICLYHFSSIDILQQHFQKTAATYTHNWSALGFLWILVSSINTIDCHDIAEIMVALVLNTITLTLGVP